MTSRVLQRQKRSYREPKPLGRRESKTASPWSASFSKRLLDISIAVFVLLLFAIPALVIAICICLESNGPVFFKQQRVGRQGKLFWIYKFRSMTVAQRESTAPGVTALCLTRDGDARITGVGRWLRKLKLDEIPQFYNVLCGEMSLIGPRPKLPQYAESLNMPYCPGITGAATLSFRHEEEILRHIHPTQMDHFYHTRIKPLKASIDARYMSQATLWSDMMLIGATVVACVAPSRVPVALRPAAWSTHLDVFVQADSVTAGE
jgi:lipopolysaccharide/colanic/teichoic acid biosynthesis glycosyltransferase